MPRSRQYDCVSSLLSSLGGLAEASEKQEGGRLSAFRNDRRANKFLRDAPVLCDVEYETFVNDPRFKEGYNAAFNFNYAFDYGSSFASTNGGVKFDAFGDYSIPVFVAAQNFIRDSTVCTSSFALSAGPVITPDPATLTNCSSVSIGDYAPFLNGAFTNTTGAQIKYVSFASRDYITPSNSGVVSSFSSLSYQPRFESTIKTILSGAGSLNGTYYLLESYRGELLVYYQSSFNETLSQFSVADTAGNAPYLVSESSVCNSAPCFNLNVGNKDISLKVVPSVITPAHLSVFNNNYDIALFLYLHCSFTLDAFLSSGSANGTYTVPAVALSRDMQAQSKICDVTFNLVGEPCHANVTNQPIPFTNNCTTLEYLNVVDTPYYTVVTPNPNNVTIFLTKFDRPVVYSTPGYSGNCTGYSYPPMYRYENTELAITQLRTNTSLTLLKDATCYFMEQFVGPAVWCQQSEFSELMFYIGHFENIPTNVGPLIPRADICFLPSLCSEVAIAGETIGSVMPVLRLAELPGNGCD